VLDEEFPSNVLPWRRVALETGAAIATVPWVVGPHRAASARD